MNAVEQTIAAVKASANLSKQVETAILAKGESNARIPLKRYAGGLELILAKRDGMTIRELHAHYTLDDIVDNCLDIYYNEYLPLANESN